MIAWLEREAPLIIWRGSVNGVPTVEIHRANLDGTAIADTSDDPRALGTGRTLADAIIDAQLHLLSNHE